MRAKAPALKNQVLAFVITVTYAPSDNADEAAPPAPGGLVGPAELDVCQNTTIGNAVD